MRSRDVIRELQIQRRRHVPLLAVESRRGRTHIAALALHRDLLCLRQEGPFAHTQSGHVTEPCSPLTRSSSAGSRRTRTRRPRGDRDADDWLLLVNLGTDGPRRSAPEPLLAPPTGRVWTMCWSSEDPHTEGGGTPALETDENWQLPGHAAC